MQLTMIQTVIGLAFCLVLAVGLAAQILFLRRLRSHHRIEWKRLGSPTLILNGSIANTLAELDFLYSGQFRALSDPELSRWCRVLITLHIVAALLLGSFFVFLPK